MLDPVHVNDLGVAHTTGDLNPADRDTFVTRNLELAAHLEADIAPLVRAIKDARAAGLRSPVGGGSSSKGGHSDPTYNAATNESRDPAGDALRRLDHLVSRANTLLEEANGIRLQWLAPVVFTAARRDEGCENCARHGQFEEVLAVSDVSGRLKNAAGDPLVMALGRWCWEFTAKTNGVLPVDWQVEAHHAGKRVRIEPGVPADKAEPVVHQLHVTLRARPGVTAADARNEIRRHLHQAELDADVVVRKAKATKATAK